METPTGTVTVRKDGTTRLYEALIDGEIVGTLAYETVGGRVSLTHSYVDQGRRHRGVASAMARYALDDLRHETVKVGIRCGFVADYVQAHSEWQGVVDIKRSALIPTRTERDSTGGL
jgi:predicted GNAT family acetyltransferase